MRVLLKRVTAGQLQLEHWGEPDAALSEPMKIPTQMLIMQLGMYTPQKENDGRGIRCDLIHLNC